MREGSSRHYVAGLPVDAISTQDAFEEIEQAVRSHRTLRVHTVNVDHMVLAHMDKEFAELILRADLVVPDGMPIVWVLRRRGVQVEIVTGVDLTTLLLEKFPCRIVLAGGQPGVAAAVGHLSETENWKASVVGTFSPSRMVLESFSQSRQLARQIRDLGPDIVLAGFGAPLQEQWLSEYGDLLGAPVVMGVGASFDFISGYARRAPRFMRDHGFEWAFRLMHDPIRLGARYLGRDWRFLPLVWSHGDRPMASHQKTEPVTDMDQGHNRV